MTMQKTIAKLKKRGKLINYILQLSAQYSKQGHPTQRTREAQATETEKTWMEKFYLLPN